MTPTGEETDIVPPDDGKTSEWITVLAATGLDYRLSCEEGRWVIHVPSGQVASARAELAAYEADDLEWPPAVATEPRAVPAISDSWSPWWVAGFVIAFYVWLGPYDGGSPLLRAAAVDGEAIFRGEWWRLITGLTVHSDPSHLAGNALCLLLFGIAACESLGGGLAWALILATGIGGNALACLFQGGHSVSVGASTSCFGALGILSACQSVWNLRRFGAARSIWSRMWIPLGAGMALLTLLGTGPRSDLAAHVFGFACGIVLCLPFTRPAIARLPAWAQRTLQFTCLVIVMTAWRAALLAAPSPQ
jgi:rhomboid protease GluP